MKKNDKHGIWWWGVWEAPVAEKFEIVGAHVHMINPELRKRKSGGKLFAVDHECLQLYTTGFDSEVGNSRKQMKQALAKLPYLSASGVPYQHRNQLQFVCPQMTEFCSKSQQGDVVPCMYSDKCVSLVLRHKMRQHVGTYIIKDKQNVPPDTCGFCGRSGTCLTK